jgi:hypothetical protein
MAAVKTKAELVTRACDPFHCLAQWEAFSAAHPRRGKSAFQYILFCHSITVAALKCVTQLQVPRFQVSVLKVSRSQFSVLSFQSPLPNGRLGDSVYRRIIRLSGRGHSNRAIANTLGVHTATVKNCLDRHRQGLGSPPEPRIIIPRIYGSVLLVVGSPHGCMGRVTWAC